VTGKVATAALGGVCLLALVMAGAWWVHAESRPLYATVKGASMDRWAAAWLITHRMEPSANLQVADNAAGIKENATAFDVPGGDAAYQRDDRRAVYEVLLDRRGSSSEATQRLAKIIHDIEVAYWKPTASETVRSVESGFRHLQRGQDRVPPACYIQYFDSVASALKTVEAGEPIPDNRLLSDCEGTDRQLARKHRNPVGEVDEVGTERLLTALANGKEVVFVDVREPEEFAEGRIPGAVNIPIRDLDEDKVEQLRGADYVVPYCIKDFRGFEMAKLLRRYGIDNPVIMNPYGLKGWRIQGLPLAGSRNGSAPEVAKAELLDCAKAGQCGEVSL